MNFFSSGRPVDNIGETIAVGVDLLINLYLLCALVHFINKFW
jgi:hypothetical protein